MLLLLLFSHYKSSARKWLVKNLGVCIPLTSGQWFWPLSPIHAGDRGTTIVFGEPISCGERDHGKNRQQLQRYEPTNDEVQQKKKEFRLFLIIIFRSYFMFAALCSGAIGAKSGLTSGFCSTL